MTNAGPHDRVEYRAEHAIEVAATPEQVWDAIATAEGLSAWMVPTQLDPRIGGNASFDHGDFRSIGVVTGLVPGQRIAFEVPWPMTDEMRAWASGVAGHDITDDEVAAVSPIATEFLIEAASGGSCVIRVVSSSYGSGADWEREYFAEMAAAWEVDPSGPDETVPFLGKLVDCLKEARARQGASQ